MDEFIKDIKNSGAIAACSDDVAQAIIDHAHLQRCETVVELGPGTGAITQKLVEELSDETLFLALELNPHFAETTQKKYPRAIVYNDTAENIKYYLNKHEKAECDCIISTLPWTLFTKELQQRILQAVTEVLKPGGQFLTVTYTFTGFLPMGIHFRKLLKETFSTIERTKPIWKNLPPAFVYHCKK